MNTGGVNDVGLIPGWWDCDFPVSCSHFAFPPPPPPPHVKTDSLHTKSDIDFPTTRRRVLSLYSDTIKWLWNESAPECHGELNLTERHVSLPSFLREGTDLLLEEVKMRSVIGAARPRVRCSTTELWVGANRAVHPSRAATHWRNLAVQKPN